MVQKEDEQFLRELHAGLEVVKSQQREVNRRLGLIERKLDEEEDQESQQRYEWKSWVLQTVGQVLIVSLLVGLGKTLGLSIEW